MEPALPPTTDPAQTQPAPALAAAAPSADLIISNAKGRTLLKTQRTSILIGRHKSCHLSLDDDRASKAHAMLVCIDRRWHLADLFSTNGTQLNDRLINGLALLHPGDRVRVGKINLQVSFAERADPQQDREAVLAEITARERHLQALESDLLTRGQALDQQGDDLDRREADVEGRESNLERCVRRLIERRAELARKELGHTTLESDLRAQGAELERKEADHQHLVQQQTAESQNLKDRAAQLQQTQDDLQARLTEAQQDAQAAAEAHSRRSAELDAREEACQSRAAELDRRVGQLSTRESSLEQMSERLAQQVKAPQDAEACLEEQKKELDRRQEEFDGRIALHLEQQERNQAEIKGRWIDFDKQKANVDSQVKKLEKQRRKVTLMFRSVESALKALDARESALNEVEQALNGQRSQQQQHQTLLAELASELERWRHTLGKHNGPADPRDRVIDRPTNGNNSPLDILRKLGATGTDQELADKLAHNPLVAEPSPASAPL